MNRMLPTVMHPNEVLDGAIVSGSFMPVSSKWSTYDFQNCPNIKALYKEHGKTINFLGVIMSNLNVALEQKERAALYVAQIANTLGADGAVVAEEGYGNPDADTVLIQLTGDHELSVLKNEVEEIRKRTSTDFRLIAAKVDDWNYELSPWKAPAVFGNEDFGDGAVRTLEQILTLCTDKSRTYYIGGYSLAGLFSLWAAYQTDVFSGIAAASPSVWFPGFIEYMKEHEIKSETVYLSLGDREEKREIR